MPHWFEYEKAHSILRCRAEGIVDDSEVRRFNLDARSLSGRLHPRASILDLSGVTSFAVSPEMLRELAAAPPSMGEFSGPRFVIAPKPHVYGMTRMFQQLTEQTRPTLVVLKQEQEAYTTLGIAAPHFDPIEGQR